MRAFFESFVVAFAMYSKIPMPKLAWNEKNMRLALLFFPLVGVVLALFEYVLYFGFKSYSLSFSPILYAAGAVLLNVMLTGGLHLDGFCDTADALSSNRETEEKLRILKDPHSGAFAVIACCSIMLLQFGSWHQLYLTPGYLGMALISFILSRSLTALALISFPSAKNNGLAALFSGYAPKKTVGTVLLIYIGFCTIASGIIAIFQGQPISCLLSALVAILLWARLYYMTRRHFGGMTGDAAGFFVVICETGLLLTAALLGGISR